MSTWFSRGILSIEDRASRRIIARRAETATAQGPRRPYLSENVANPPVKLTKILKSAEILIDFAGQTFVPAGRPIKQAGAPRCQP
jgi:hypothetical protein